MLERPTFITPTSARIGDETIHFLDPSFIHEQLLRAYGEEPPVVRFSLRMDREDGSEPAPPKRPPPWFVGFAKTFKDDLSSTDRKLQGRILEALAKIVDAPMQLIGDTEKPLTGDLAGFWRYRIGDFRLVYYPDPKSGNITLYHFSARGDVYA